MPDGVVPPHFNPRSPRGGATQLLLHRGWDYGISIHAPHEGERPHLRTSLPSSSQFQSTLPTRGSDLTIVANTIAIVIISIHAPHEGERRLTLTGQAGTTYFNPRSPRGGATENGLYVFAVCANFNPRSPRGGATDSPRDCEPVIIFQSTLPTRGSDSHGNRACSACWYFNPRSPSWGAWIEIL